MNWYKRSILLLTISSIMYLTCSQKGRAKQPAEQELSDVAHFKGPSNIENILLRVRSDLNVCNRYLTQASKELNITKKTQFLVKAMDILCKDIAIDIIHALQKAHGSFILELQNLEKELAQAQEEAKKALDQAQASTSKEINQILKDHIKEASTNVSTSIGALQKYLTDQYSTLTKESRDSSYDKFTKKAAASVLFDERKTTCSNNLFKLYASLDAFGNFEVSHKEMAAKLNSNLNTSAHTIANLVWPTPASARSPAEIAAAKKIFFEELIKLTRTLEAQKTTIMDTIHNIKPLAS